MEVEGLNDEEMIKALRPNYSNQSIKDAMNQAKQEVPEDNVLEELDQIQPYDSDSSAEEELEEEAPSPDSEDIGEEQSQGYVGDNYNEPRYSSDETQQLVEAVVNERWEELTSRMGDLSLWKEGINTDLESIKQELLRTQERINNLQNIMVGKVMEYNKSVNDISVEMKALEQVFQRILQPLTTNIKDLNRVTEELKSKTIVKKTKK